MLNKSLFGTFLLVLLSQSAVAERQVCIYQASSGRTVQVNSIKNVPNRLRSSARCFKPSDAKQNDRLDRPDQIQLEGNVRRESINTPIGPVELRWPRSVEGLFGRTPLRAMTNAARTVSRSIKTAAFPTEMQRLNIPWKVVFMDANLPTAQIPSYLVNNCHPGWMTPPGNIYIVAQRVAGGCSGNTAAISVNDENLTETLVHELAHALEFRLLRYRGNMNRMRAEGFATWFEMYAAGNSSSLSASRIKNRTYSAAKYAISSSPDRFSFSGSGADYSRAAMYFSAIEDKFGVRGVIEVYETMAKHNLDFFSAIEKAHSWDRARLEKEVRGLLK